LSPGRRAPRWRLPAGLVALALVSAACSTGPSRHRPTASSRPPASTAPASSAPSRASTTARGSTTTAPPAALRWTPCHGHFQCATVPVPLDYSHPHGRTINLALVRLPAGQPKQRIGALLVNPGGPGASGVQFVVQQYTLFSPALRAHFDIVGFDPRGVGQSDPVRCENGAALSRYINVNPAPRGPSGVKALVTSSRQFARSCTKDSGKELLANVGTVDAARDMDRIRAALGEPKLNYLGFSYGTFLGATYAQMFPTHIRAMVLDGALNPDLGTQALDLQQGEGFERDLDDFLANCQSSPTCPLRREPGGAKGAFDRLVARIRSGRSIPTGTSRALHAGEGYLGIVAALYSRSTWPFLAQGVYQALHGNARILLALSDAYTERRPNGTYSNTLAANTAINCVDRPSPSKLSTYEKAARRFEKAAPVFGELEDYSPLTCVYWPVPPTDHPRPLHARGAPPILVVGTTADPATPYAWAKALAHQLSSGVLLTHVGVGHTAYGDSSCVRRIADAYLISLKVPKSGTVCHH